MDNDEAAIKKGAKDFALGLAFYSGASILGPIIVIGGIGYFLDKAFNGRHLILLGSILLAFVITNILIFRKSRAVMEEIKKIKVPPGKNGYDDEEE